MADVLKVLLLVLSVAAFGAGLIAFASAMRKLDRKRRELERGE